MTETQGRGVTDHDDFWADPPGVWWKWEHVLVRGHDVVRWLVRPPCGHHFMLAAANDPDSNDRHHEVDEHDDGTISVQPKPGNTNSILCECGWHGYIDHGVWRTT